MNTITNHYNPLQVYFRGDEVKSGKETFICSPPTFQTSIIGVHPSVIRYWRKKKEGETSIDAKLAEIHRLRTKQMHDHELLMPVLRPVEWDVDFLMAVQTEILHRVKN